MSSNPNALVRDHEPSDSDSKPLLDPGHAEAGTSHELHNPVYQPDYRYSYTDENFKHYPSGPDQSQAKLDDPFTPKPEQYNQPQDYARQTRYEDMGEYAMQLCLNGASSEPPAIRLRRGAIPCSCFQVSSYDGQTAKHVSTLLRALPIVAAD